MKTPLIFATGIALGWLGAVAFQAAETRRAELTADAAGASQHEPARRTVAQDPRSRPQRERPALERAYNAAFEARLRAATSQNPEVPPAASLPGLSDARFNAWLAAAAFPDSLRDEIRARFAAFSSASAADPLAADSEFDGWLRGRLGAESLGAWDTLREEHAADVVERRANQLLVGLQGALSLDPSQKDALYTPLVEWVRENPPDLASDQEPSAARRFNELAAMIPADQHDALAEWVAEFLPGYWLRESGVE